MLALAAAAVGIHAATRGLGLGAPGHQGAAFFALLTFGAMLASRPASTSVAGLASATLAVWPFGISHDVVGTLAYAWPGVGYSLLLSRRAPAWSFVLAAGLLHALKPLLRFGINLATGWPYGSLRSGVIYPTLTHFAYAAGGALLGLLLARSAQAFMARSRTR